jgi:hypothetical protein
MPASVDPKMIVYFNGQYVPLAEARVGILTHALHYGFSYARRTKRSTSRFAESASGIW